MPEGSAVIPMGKYKGQPVEVLAADPGYRDWLLSQDWFREKYVNIYQTVINYGGAPQDSPEHNQMQALFLQDSHCMRLASLLWPSRDFRLTAPDPDGDALRIAEYEPYLETKWSNPRVTGRQFETGGWDVRFTPIAARYDVTVTKQPQCLCGECDHSDCPDNAPCESGLAPPVSGATCKHRLHGNKDYEGSHHSPCPWSPARMSRETFRWMRTAKHTYQANWQGDALVELKPDLGDDFPSVLRQVTRYEHGYHDRLCVVVRRASFEQVTWDEVVAIFKASSIKLIKEGDFIAPVS